MKKLFIIQFRITRLRIEIFNMGNVQEIQSEVQKETTSKKIIKVNLHCDRCKTPIERIIITHEETYCKDCRKWNKISEHENSIESSLEKNLWDNSKKNYSEDKQWIEDLKNLSESHLAALQYAEDWHQKYLEVKVEKKLAELGVGSSGNQCLIENKEFSKYFIKKLDDSSLFSAHEAIELLSHTLLEDLLKTHFQYLFYPIHL